MFAEPVYAAVAVGMLLALAVGLGMHVLQSAIEISVAISPVPENYVMPSPSPTSA